MHIKGTNVLIAVLAVIIAIICVLAASVDAHAETKDGIPVILIAEGPESATQEEPPISNVSNALDALDNAFPYIAELPLSADIQRYLYTAWTGAGYDYAIALGLIDVETGGTFNPNAINHNTHDYGLFQINRRSWFKTCKRLFGISDMAEMLDPALNIQAALYVYGDCVARYGQTEKALVAYNTGYGKSGSTSYSRKVLSMAEKWRGVMAIS